MNAPVDVLAVMDGCIAAFDDVSECPDDVALSEDTKKARAAVAELIEAANAAADVLAETYAKYQTKIGPFASQSQKANGKLRAALARVGGEA